MFNFSKHRFFKTAILLSSFFLGMIIYELTTKKQTIIKQFLISLSKPILSSTANFNQSVSFFFDGIFKGTTYKEENDALKDELSILLQKTAELNEIKAENAQLKQALEVKQNNKNFDIFSASLIAQDQFNKCCYTVNAGSNNRIKKGNYCITRRGLVGIITDVKPLTSTLTTILSPTGIQLPAIVSSKDEEGIISGNQSLFASGQCCLSTLPKSSTCKPDDLVTISSNSDSCPSSIAIGKIVKVSKNHNGISSYAVVQPIENLKTIKKN